MNVDIAIIGGTGVYNPSIMDGITEETVTTPYGNVQIKIGTYRNRPLAFMNRHGDGHTMPPHLINYRANIAALKKIGVKCILATAAVGSLNPSMHPGHFVFCDQFIDFTKARPSTFFDGGEAGVVHIDMTNPYCADLRDILTMVANSEGLVAHGSGTYICAEGPRFETTGEIKMFRHLGGDLVGMTGVPEAPLAREAEMCYATVAMVTNFAAGISPTNLTHQEVLDTMSQNSENIRRLLIQTVMRIDPNRPCVCHRGIETII